MEMTGEKIVTHSELRGCRLLRFVMESEKRVMGR
jgi:hypothetical protein